MRIGHGVHQIYLLLEPVFGDVVRGGSVVTMPVEKHCNVGLIDGQSVAQLKPRPLWWARTLKDSSQRPEELSKDAAPLQGIHIGRNFIWRRHLSGRTGGQFNSGLAGERVELSLVGKVFKLHGGVLDCIFLRELWILVGVVFILPGLIGLRGLTEG